MKFTEDKTKERILLVLDKHGSHICEYTRKRAHQLGIDLIFSPSGSPHFARGFILAREKGRVPMEYEIEGNTALVTASSTGLGRASAAVLAREGANVVVNGRDRESLDETVAHLDEKGRGDVIGIAADLTNRDDVERLVHETVGEFGGLDHLVTSTGGPPSGSFRGTTDEDWYAAFDLLVMSVVRTVREAAEHLSAGDGGTIVTITSRTVKEAVDDIVLSNAVRMAVIGLEKSLSNELSPAVRSNAVLPGPHETDRIEELIADDVQRGTYDDYESGREARGREVPLKRMGAPEELGETVAFLSSPLSSFINGAAIPVDGGITRSNL